MGPEDPFEAYKKALDSHYAHLISYSDLILGIGYAGLFATWSLTKETLGRTLSLWAGALMLASLFFFVLFEIIRSTFTSLDIERQFEVLLKPEQYPELMATFNATHRRMAGQFRAMWRIFFSVSFFTAFCAGAIMMYAFVRQLLNGT